MKNILTIILAFAITTSCSPKRDLTHSSGKPHELRPEMAIEKLPDTRFLYLPVTGGYHKHLESIQKLSAFLEQAGIPGKNCTGIYPEDPDAVPAERLDWEIGFEVPEDTPAPETGEFKTRTLEGATALVVKSSVQNSAAHGIYCKIWLLEHGYVQTQPTRMIYHMDSDVPEEQSTTIIFPVVKRTRDIPVITGCTLGHKL
ncbi:MAG: GyrI-like domain-containing protein [Phaeodactylibacter sp.]|nr:GyrI-like domain-containing protein [Phaeodactylibacter sp.]